MTKLNITPAFQQVFFTVLFLTLLSGGISIWMASNENLTPQENRIFENSTSTWQMGVGAIFGLLGGKAAEIWQPNQEED